MSVGAAVTPTAIQALTTQRWLPALSAATRISLRRVSKGWKIAQTLSNLANAGLAEHFWEMMMGKSLFLAVILMTCAAQATAQVNRFKEQVGRWNKLGEGQEMRIEPDGAVFSQSGDFLLSGAAGSCITAGANFCFEGKNQSGAWRCAYHISFLEGAPAIDFRVTHDSYQYCPRGLFQRSR